MSKFNIFLATTLLFFNFQAHSQEIDEEFLKSLPLDAQRKIELANDEQELEDLDVLLNSKTSIQKNEALLKYLSQQVEILNSSINPLNVDEAPQRFGESFFNDFQSTFMPVNVANLGNEYIVDVGDGLVINLFGKITDQEEVTVARDGTITIPSLGKISVAGKTFNEVENLFNIFLKSKAIGVDGTVSLSKLRDIQILILGYVFQPGIYTLSGGASMLGAIKAAGGIDKNGSFREISHLRNGKVLRSFDLYDVFINGVYDDSYQLRSGDSLLVNPIKKSIPISGGVNRPAIYELLDNENLDDLLRYAGGISEYSLKNNFVLIKKYSDLNAKEVMLNISDISDYKLELRDQVVIPFYAQEIKTAKQVTLKGWVQRPGIYSIRDGDTFEDLINKAGGLKDGAYSFGISLFRDDAKDLENELMLLEYSKSIDNIVSSIGRPGSGDAGSALNVLKEGLKSRAAIGRVVNNFLTNPQIELNDKDEIIVPRLQKVVYLFGEFNKPINPYYEDSKDIKDYVDIGGGLTRNATGYLVVIDPDGKASVYKDKNLLNLLSLNNIEIYPGSIIYAPRDIGKLTGIQYASSVAPILSSLALSLASLNSINN